MLSGCKFPILAPARVQPVTTYKAPPSRTPKRVIREATQPY